MKNYYSNTDHFCIDTDEANKFLQLLAGDQEANFCFQTFPDYQVDDENRSIRRRNLTRVFNGKFDQFKRELEMLNKAGAGIFVTINETDGLGRATKNIKGVRANFADIDDGRMNPVYPLAPSFEVITARGVHVYWLLNKPYSKDNFSGMQKRIIDGLKSDPVVHDLSRVMRLPGYFHLKDPSRPILIKLRLSNELRKHSFDELSCAFPVLLDEHHRSFVSWVVKLPTLTGSRNNQVVKICREGFGRKIDPAFIWKVIADFCERSKLDTEEAREVFNRHKIDHLEKPFTSFRDFKNPTETEEDIARAFIESQHNVCGERTVHLYRDDVYTHDGSKYVVGNKKELGRTLVRWLQQNKKSKFVQNKTYPVILRHLEALLTLPSSTRLNSNLDNPDDLGLYVALKNTVLYFDKGKAKLDSKSPTASLFNTSCIPLDYNKYATCPTWDNFVAQVFYDQSVINLVQEWFGYCLIHDTTQGKAVIFYGEGANGKTVITTVLSSLLGEHNVSSVQIESFDPKRTFPLAAIDGKLANIVEDMDEVEKVAEGILKSIITGGVINVERKNRDPYSMIPTARLTFATNNLPRLRDSSAAFPRRLILVPMLFQILDESKQRKELISRQFWIQSGELPGILNWALKGLIRLYSRDSKSFNIPISCSAALNQFLIDTNPARDFLRSNYAFKASSEEIHTGALFNQYKIFCEENGYKPFGAKRFSKEVQRVFPTAERSTSKKFIKLARDFIWIGLVINPDGETQDSGSPPIPF